MRGRALTFALVALGGCAIAAEDVATPLEVDDVPYDLLDPDAPSVAPVLDGRTVPVCLLRADELVVVERQVEREADLRAVVVSLASTSEAEAAAGLETGLGGPEDIAEVRVARGVATVDLGPTADQTLTPDPLATIAQVVCTLTGLPGVGSVRFTLDGDPIDVPREDGSLTDEPVSRDDYDRLLAPP